MRTINCRINRRATAAGIALWSLKHKLTASDITLLEKEIERAQLKDVPYSSRLASVLTAEILLRQQGAAL